MKSRIVLNLAILSLLIAGIICAEEAPRMLGAGCSYEKIPGEAKIISITKTEESTRQETVSGGPGYEGYEIKFKFNPLQQKQEYGTTQPAYESILEKEHTLQLTNSWYPGDKFLKKYKIEVGKTLNCVLGLLSNGSCSPVIFEFADINTSDYFETEK